MTQPEARQILHSAAEIRRAVETLARERRERTLLSWSEQVDQALREQGIGPDDVAARGGPSARTVNLMLKANNIRLSTMAEFAAALGEDFDLEVRLVRKQKA
jgi:hypothetical protein